MSKVKIVTDSTADLPADLFKTLDIDILPVTLVLDGVSYRDRVDMPVQDFYKNIGTYDKMATEPVGYDAYAETYKQLVRNHEKIIFLHCSNALSRTYHNGMQVHEDFKGTHERYVYVIDSKQTSIGLGYIVIAAARAAMEGKNFTNTAKLIYRLIANTKTLVAVPSLKYLRKGKKISGLKSLLGSAMGVKPVLGTEDGVLKIKSKIFSKEENIMLEMIQHIKDDVGDTPVDLVIGHAGAPHYADALKDAVGRKLNCRDIYISDLGPSIGINTGPMATAIAYCKY